MTTPALTPTPTPTLEQYIAEHLTTPFQWGQHDCVTFAIGWLSIKSGKDWLSHLTPWRSAKQAFRTRQKVGGLLAQFDAHLHRVPPAFAKDGDIALLGGCTVFVFSGPYIVAPGHSGLVFLDRCDPLSDPLFAPLSTPLCTPLFAWTC